MTQGRENGIRLRLFSSLTRDTRFENGAILSRNGGYETELEPSKTQSSRPSFMLGASRWQKQVRLRYGLQMQRIRGQMAAPVYGLDVGAVKLWVGLL